MKGSIPLGDSLLSKDSDETWIRSLTSSMCLVIHVLFSFLSFTTCPVVKIIATLPTSQSVCISNKMMLMKTLRKGLLNARWQRSCFYCSMSSLFKIESYLKTCAVGSQAAWSEQIFIWFNSNEKLHISFSHFSFGAEPSLTFNVTFRPVLFLHRLHTG